MRDSVTQADRPDMMSAWPESNAASARHDVGMAEIKDNVSRPFMTMGVDARHDVCIRISR
jgi:hypothetical protein